MDAEHKSRRQLAEQVKAETVILIHHSENSVPQVFGGYRSCDQDLPPLGSPRLNQSATGSIQYVWVASAHQPAAIHPDVRLDEPRTAALMSRMLAHSSPRPTAAKQVREPQRWLNTNGFAWVFRAVKLKFRLRWADPEFEPNTRPDGDGVGAVITHIACLMRGPHARDLVGQPAPVGPVIGEMLLTDWLPPACVPSAGTASSRSLDD